MIRATRSRRPEWEREWSGNARRLSHADRAAIEALIQRGATLEVAATAVGCSTKSIQRFLATTGGLKRRLKPRSPLRLSRADREELSRSLVAGDSFRCIARRLGRAPSTVSREVAWSGCRDRYRAWRGDHGAIERGRRPKPAADLSLHSAAHLNAVARELNGRPRQTLSWMKPSEVFSRTVASID
jgi:AraC-like DNA-binding protein